MSTPATVGGTRKDVWSEDGDTFHPPSAKIIVNSLSLIYFIYKYGGTPLSFPFEKIRLNDYNEIRGKKQNAS